jgi:D-hexose-6-phosphate mutarotase
METLKQHEIPGKVTISEGNGGLPVIHVETEWSTAEVYLHGAHVTRFQKKGETPLLFLSEASEFAPGKAIRGGVPLIFPWFGPREGMPAHGFARVMGWSLMEASVLPDGSIRLYLHMPAAGSNQVSYVVTVGKSLILELVVVNNGASDFTFENCLHTYFQTGDIGQVRITGLQGTRYFDKVIGGEFTETGETLSIGSEVDRVFFDTESTVEIIDPELQRVIRVSKSGSRSTVVWNPWIEKSQRMGDFGDDEYRSMVCVESGNVGSNAITLGRGASSVLKVEIDSVPLS